MSLQKTNRLGMTGAHRTGKSTLAFDLSCNKGCYPFVKTSVSDADVWKVTGIRPDDVLSFAERVMVQIELLHHMKDVVWKNAHGVFDRTFIDLIGYLFVNMDNTCTNLLKHQVEDFVQECVDATNHYFDAIIYVPPAIAVRSEEFKQNKTFLSDPYIQAVDNHIVAMLRRLTIPVIEIPKEMTSQSSRMEFLLTELAPSLV